MLYVLFLFVLDMFSVTPVNALPLSFCNTIFSALEKNLAHSSKLFGMKRTEKID